MQYERKSNVICLGDPKQAALFFDECVPISLLAEAWFDLKISKKAKCVISTNTNKSSPPLGQIFRELININDLSEPDFFKLFENLVKYFNQIQALVEFGTDSYPLRPELQKIRESKTLNGEAFEVFENLRRIAEGIIPEPSQKIAKKMQEMSIKTEDQEGLLRPSDLLELLGMCWVENARFLSIGQQSLSFRDALFGLSLSLPCRKPAVYLPAVCFDLYEGTEEDLTLSIANIRLIDTKKAQWDHILEFRKDEDSRRKLRNLRLFLHTNYEGKTLEFIEDDLNKRLDDYQNICKDWGFDTLTSSISALIDAKNLVGLLAGSTCATLFGGPIAGLVAGASIELSKIAIMLTRKKYAFHKLKRDHDLAYLIEARERLPNS